MSNRELARLLVRLAGLVIIVWTLIDLPRNLDYLLAAKYTLTLAQMLKISIAPSALSLICGLVMYWSAGPIADRFLITPGTISTGDSPSFDGKAIEEIALSVLGTYILADGLAEEVYYWGKLDLFYSYMGLYPGLPHPIPQAEFGGIGAATTRVVLGMVMILFSRGIVALRRGFLAFRPTPDAE